MKINHFMAGENRPRPTGSSLPTAGKDLRSSVRPAAAPDTPAIAALHCEAFPRQRDSVTWVSATLAAAPRLLAYVLEHDGEIAGYIFWAQKSGIRPAAVLELEQIAVPAHLRGNGFGKRLIRESLALVADHLRASGQTVKSVLVSTRADNRAQRLYRRVLGAEVVATLDNLYSATEVLMLAERPHG